MYEKTTMVCVLDNETREEIKELLELELSKTFSGNELAEYLEDGMDGRLCDLEDTIDITSLQTIYVQN